MKEHRLQLERIGGYALTAPFGSHYRSLGGEVRATIREGDSRAVEVVLSVGYHGLAGTYGKSKKRKPLPPRTKRMNRKQRLQSALRWVAEYEGSNIIRSYRKRYDVDWLCAVKELQLLGVELDPVHVAQLRCTVEEQVKRNRRRWLERQQAANDDASVERHPYSEGECYFVAGYTSNGAPYGVTWEEAREQGLIEPFDPEYPPVSSDG